MSDSPFMSELRRRYGRRESRPYWTRAGEVNIRASSPEEQRNLEAGDRIYDPNKQYTSPDDFRDDLIKTSGGRTPMPAYGPEGPPGGMAKLGYKMQGPPLQNAPALGFQLPQTPRMAFPGIPQSYVPGSQVGAAGNGRMEWPGITASQPPVRADTQPVGPGMNIQQAQADLLRQRAG